MQLQQLMLNTEPYVSYPMIFSVQLHPTPEVPRTSVDREAVQKWTKQRFHTDTFEEIVPGVGRLRWPHYNNSAFLSLEIIDSTAPDAENVLGADEKALFAIVKQEQAELKKSLSAPTVQSAIIAKLLAQLVKENDITAEFAQTTLMQECALGGMAAQGLIQRAGELLARGHSLSS